MCCFFVTCNRRAFFFFPSSTYSYGVRTAVCTRRYASYVPAVLARRLPSCTYCCCCSHITSWPKPSSWSLKVLKPWEDSQIPKKHQNSDGEARCFPSYCTRDEERHTIYKINVQTELTSPPVSTQLVHHSSPCSHN